MLLTEETKATASWWAYFRRHWNATTTKIAIYLLQQQPINPYIS